MSGSASGGGEARALAELVGLVTRYGSLTRAIVAIISLYILNGVLDVVGIVVGSVLFAFDLIVGSLATAQRLLLGALGAVGIDILAALTSLQREIAGVVEGAGPAGPVIAVAAGAIGLYVLWRVGVALVGELPGGSTLVDLLGLR